MGALREQTKEIKIGNRILGGSNPVLIQSMTNTKTEDVKATVEQILRLEEAGCELIRCAVPTKEAAVALKSIKKKFTFRSLLIFILITVWQLRLWRMEQIKYGLILEI